MHGWMLGFNIHVDLSRDRLVLADQLTVAPTHEAASEHPER